MTDIEYITLWISLPGQMLDRRHSVDPAVFDWLVERYGVAAKGELQWYANLDNDKFQWHYRGRIVTDPTKEHCFLFRTIEQALMFKLVWGGS